MDIGVDPENAGQPGLTLSDHHGFSGQQAHVSQNVDRHGLLQLAVCKDLLGRRISPRCSVISLGDMLLHHAAELLCLAVTHSPQKVTVLVVDGHAVDHLGRIFLRGGVHQVGCSLQDQTGRADGALLHQQAGRGITDPSRSSRWPVSMRW